MGQQPVVTRVKPMFLGQRGAQKPLPMQTPFTARRKQPVTRQPRQHLIPAGALATGRQESRPKLVQPQLLPQVQRQPASPPLSRAPQLQLPQSQPDNLLSPHRGPHRNGFWKQSRRGRRPVRLWLGKQLDGFAPSQLLGVVDLAQIKHVPLHHSASRHAPVLNKAPATVFLAVLLADFAAQKHNGCQLCTETLSLIHISEPTRRTPISYAV